MMGSVVAKQLETQRGVGVDRSREDVFQLVGRCVVAVTAAPTTQATSLEARAGARVGILSLNGEVVNLKAVFSRRRYRLGLRMRVGDSRRRTK